jgi:benzoate-CoA ligase family protein
MQPLLHSLPARYNLADDLLDRNLREGRAAKACVHAEGRSWTYAQVAERTRRAAAAFRRAGAQAEDRVLIVLPDGIEFVEAWFGVLRAGCVFAMVNPLLHAEQYAEYVDYVKPRAVVVHDSVLPAIAEALERSRIRPAVFVVGEAGDRLAWAAALDAEDPASSLAETEPTGPDDLAGWLFTSGSTGRPKACVHAHRDFAYNIETYAREIARYAESDVCLSVPKLFFGYATGTNLMFPFRFGGSVVLYPGRATVDELLAQIARHRPTLLTGVPTMINNLLKDERLATTDLSSLRVVLSAGEALPTKLYEDWKACTGVEILDGIGSAEMFHIYISNRFGEVVPGSLGRLVPGYEAEIVDPDGRPVPDGQPGRLRVRGGSTAICYHGDKEQSVRTFQGEWCTTADVFRRDEAGLHWFEGRDDDLLKVSGIWVSPLEIENALLAHEGVAEVCVVGREDEERLVKPCAFVVLRPGHERGEAMAARLKEHVKSRLAPYKYPRWFEWRETLPKNDRGKVARKELKAWLARGAEDQS